MDERTGQPMTKDNWNRYMAEFMEYLRAQLPAQYEIVHNTVWWQAGGLSNPYMKRAMEAATHMEMERGVIDNLSAHYYGEALAWADYAHSRGKGVIWDAQATWGREYQVATYLLASNGNDGMSHPEGEHPHNWWSGYDTDLGDAVNQWSRLPNGVYSRDFQLGKVLVNPPEGATQTVNLGANYRKLDGQYVTSVTLSEKQGVVLQK